LKIQVLLKRYNFLIRQMRQEDYKTDSLLLLLLL
jgi:hypothetical protein